MKLTLAIDLMTERGKNRSHFGSLFLEQDEVQAYWVAALDRHEHGQLNEEELKDYIDQLVSKGFEQVSVDDILSNKPRPPNYYIILSKDHDWCLDEIIVLNRFQDHPELSALVEKLNLSRLAHHLLVTKWETVKKWVNKRGNVQLNHGSNHLDIRDDKKIRGMNLAREHVRPKTLVPGVGEDATTEDSLIKGQIIVTSIFELIAKIFSKEPPFTNVGRRSYFATPFMEQRGYDPDSLRSESGAFIYSGILPERMNGVHTAQCAFHTDNHNDHREEGGMNHNICVSQIVDMHFPNRTRSVKGRAALNQFNKECNGSSVERLKKTMDLCGMVRVFMKTTKSDKGEHTNVNWTGVLDMVAQLAKKEGADFATVQAHANKDCHYSWFVHVILTEIIPVYGWDVHVLCEVLYTMSLTPSAIGWRTGVRYALMARHNGCNLFENFIHEMVAKDEAVAHCYGKKPRHQVHSGALITLFQAMSSMHNELQLFIYACHPQSVTRTLYEDMASSEVKVSKTRRLRGLRNVSDLTAHDIVNVATKVGVVTNTRHIQKITIARNTETAKRLKRFGICSDAHLREVVYMLSSELGIEDYQIVENLICETLRLHEGGGTKYLGVDTVAVDQPLYQFVEDVLYCIGRGGDRKEVDLNQLREMNPPKGYAPCHKWWNMDVDNPGFSLGPDYKYYLTKRSKVLKRDLETMRR